MRTATKQEAINGNSNDTVITPLRLKQVLDTVDINPGEGGGGSDSPVYTAGDGISIINNVISNTITKTSQLTNDSNFITEADLPDININDPVPINSIWDYEGDTVPDGFIEVEEEQVVVEETDPTVPAHVKAITIEDIEKWNSGTGNVDLTDYAKKSDIPTKTSELTNDSNFTTSSTINSIMVVDTLPETEVEGVLYLIKESEIVEPDEPSEPDEPTNLWENATIMHEYFFDTDKSILDYKDGVNYYSAYIPCESNTKYKITRTLDGYRFRIANTSAIPAQGVSYSNYLKADDLKDIDYTTSSNAQYLVIYYVGSSETLDPTALFNDISVTKVS